MPAISSPATSAVRASDFLGSLGVNTHIDFTWTSYGNLQVVKDSINYIGIKNLRDSANNPADIGQNGWWQQVADATGAKFDAFIGQGSPKVMQDGLTYITQLANQHILNFIEGGNEQDGVYAAMNGNTLAITAQFQQQVYTAGYQLGIPVINMSFGAGWDKPTGNYGEVGNLGAYADYANAHTYFGTGDAPSYNINFVNSLAQMAAGDPVIITEIGWYTTGVAQDLHTVSETVQAKYMLDGLLEAYKAGNVKTYLYELLDQRDNTTYSEDNFGLFQADGTPKPAAVALHNLTTLLADKGSDAGTFTPTALNYNLTGLQATDKTMLLEKSDGTYWLAIWNETRLKSATSAEEISVPTHNVTLTLGAQASHIVIYDPLTGAVSSPLDNALNAQITVPDHPVLVQIVLPDTPAASKPLELISLDTTASLYSPPVVEVPAEIHDLAVSAPATLSTSVKGHAAVDIHISDSWSQQHASTLSMVVGVGRGTLSMNDAGGKAVAGSGTNSIQLTGTLNQLNDQLKTLVYNAGNFDGKANLVVDVWNQAGDAVKDTVMVDITTPYDYRNLDVISVDAVKLGVGDTVQLAGTGINDLWAQHHEGMMALNLNVTTGSLSMNDASGNIVAGSGTKAIQFIGTHDQINDALSTLSYKAPSVAATGSLSINIWNQAGFSVTQNVAISDIRMTSKNTVSGTAKNDIISGVTGCTLKGGAGEDTFCFTPTNTGVGARATHIADFNKAGGDSLNLHGFGLAADDFVGTGAFKGGGEASFGYDTSLVDANNRPYTLVKIDSNGDRTSDYEVRLDNIRVTLQADDFSFF